MCPHGPWFNRKRTALTAGECTHRTVTTTASVPKSQVCSAAAAAPLLVLEGMPEHNRAEPTVHAPLAVSILVHASAEMEHPIAVGRAQAHLSIDHPGTATEAH